MKVTVLPGADVVHVRLVDRDPHLHARQVLGDQEQAGGVQARHDRLPDVHPAVDDDAFHRRADAQKSKFRRALSSAAWAAAIPLLRLGDLALRLRPRSPRPTS